MSSVQGDYLVGELKPCFGRQFLRAGWDLVTSDSGADNRVLWLQGMAVGEGRGPLGRQTVLQRWSARDKLPPPAKTPLTRPTMPPASQ